MSVFQTRGAQFAGAALVVAVAVAGYIWSQDAGPVVPDTAKDTAAQPKPAAQPSARTATAPQDTKAAATVPPAPQTPDPAASPATPSFDEVRREGDGMTVIAGRAAPGARVSVISNGAEVASAQADRSGKFATLAILPPDGSGKILSLSADAETGPVASVEEVILAPITAPAVAQVALAEPADVSIDTTSEAMHDDTAPEAASAPVAEPQGEAPEDSAPEMTEFAAVAAQPDPARPSADTPVALLKSDADGVELLPGTAPEVTDRIALDTITYSDEGEVRLAGRAQAQASSVRVYLDNRSVGALEVDPQGRWRGDIENIKTGIYTLRVDELDQGGDVISRVETPFKRESPEVLARATADNDGPIKAVTVQEGATLWAIARERYGDPTLYVRVFAANRSSIRDPDLIYPGQVFDLPD
ncbi:Ig-like domain-containing protein [Sulfitobacter sp. EE-36]|uniref:LysM peptidoglycan-binding domain-containing protein n=1 Tax=Sulfitobacter TaxID=60136 RepID=UPI000066B033|nr:Ig-like domain-containing protein [Sulfitobacter sp. EE-36]EAP83900.1 lysM domain protein [Sulfitobacter sp. EE-36]